jgi:hypothetical protein
MRLRAALCVGCLALAAGCALLGEPEAPEAPEAPEKREPAPWVQPGGPPTGDVENLVEYFSYIRKLPAGDLTREYETARQAYNRGRGEYHRVRFAMLLSLPNTPFSDDSRALDVLEPVLRKGEGRLYPLAQMLGSHIQEQKRLNASVQGLQQKLDALKSLERSIIERSR